MYSWHSYKCSYKSVPNVLMQICNAKDFYRRTPRNAPGKKSDCTVVSLRVEGMSDAAGNQLVWEES